MSLFSKFYRKFIFHFNLLLGGFHFLPYRGMKKLESENFFMILVFTKIIDALVVTDSLKIVSNEYSRNKTFLHYAQRGLHVSI